MLRHQEKTMLYSRLQWAGLTAGTLDLIQACILFGRKVPLFIAAGLLGRQALKGGTGSYILGILLHFFIACRQRLFTRRLAASWFF